MNMRKAFDGPVELTRDGRAIRAGGHIAAAFTDADEARAAAHAINCHDDLVEALEGIKAHLHHGRLMSARLLATAALAKAKGDAQ